MFLKTFAYLLLVVLFSLPGYSTVIYTTGTNGIDNNSPGIDASSGVAAVPFTLTSEATIESVTAYAMLFSGWDGTMNYDFFTNSGFYPSSTPLAQGAGQGVTTSVFYEIYGVIPVYAVTFNLASPVTLTPGQYWLGVHMQTSFAQNYAEEWIALDGDPGNVLDARSGGGTFDNWSLGAENNPFTLNGVFGVPVVVPEPSYEPLLLMSAGCIATGLIKRRRRVGAEFAKAVRSTGR